MAYSELIKNFEKIRSYMKDFYVYGFKSREGYDSKKSLRSYDDERRRMESWLGEHMKFVRTPEGKNVFISIDSRISKHNPLYNAFKAKSFTDGDMTLHFILFDILNSPEISLPLSEITAKMDENYLSAFNDPMVFDESTVRKKLKEYVDEGIIICEKQGKKAFYRRADSVDIGSLSDALDFFSEIAPCGVIGSFLLDKISTHDDVIFFKHHYITDAIDSEVLTAVFYAMQNHNVISAINYNRKRNEKNRVRLIPIRVLISVQSGRQYLMAYVPEYNKFVPYRIDYLSHIKIEDQTARFNELRELFVQKESKIWGVNLERNFHSKCKTEHIDITLRIADDEEFIIRRLMREKRNGKIKKLDNGLYRFTADVYDTSELIPWIRSFICRIEKMNLSNRTIENRLKDDLKEMYEIYGLNGGDK